MLIYRDEIGKGYPSKPIRARVVRVTLSPAFLYTPLHR